MSAGDASATPRPSSTRVAGVLALAVLTLFLLRLAGPSNLLSHDQERPASYVLDASVNGHWIYQRDWTGEIASKPPLHTWLGAMAASVAGATRFAVAFPSGLATLGTVLLLLLFGRRLLGDRASFLAALAFLLSMATAKQITLVRTDALFSFTVMLAALAAFAAWRRRAGWIWFWLACAAATLTKGPLGILLGSFGLLAACRRGESISPGRSFGWGLALFALLTGGWFALAYAQAGHALADKLIFDELLGHAAGGKHGPPLSGFYKPPVYFLSRFAPWSLLALAGLWRVWRRPAADADERAFERFLFFWFAGGLALFSVASHQRGDLIVPLIPPAAWLAGREMARLTARWGFRSIAVASALAAAAVFVVIAVNDRNSLRADRTVARAAAIEDIAARIRRGPGPRADIQCADVPFAFQFHLGTMRPHLSFEGAARFLSANPAGLVAVSDLARLEAAAGRKNVRVVEAWPLPDGGKVHLVASTQR